MEIERDNQNNVNRNEESSIITAPEINKLKRKNEELGEFLKTKS